LIVFKTLNAQYQTEVVTYGDIKVKKSYLKKLLRELNGEKEKKQNFKMNYVFTPHYSSKYKLGLGAIANGVYSTNLKDSLLPLSNVSLSGSITTTGSYFLSIGGNNFFKGGSQRLNYELFFASLPTNFWGLGYYNAMKDANKSSYTLKNLEGHVEYTFEVLRNFYLGPHIGYTHIKGSNFSNSNLINGKHNIANYFNYGAVLNYDSRDFVYNPESGIYALAKQLNYVYNSSKPFFSTILQFNFYKSLGKGTIFASDVYSQFKYGDVPWLMLSSFDGINRMRGYYQGRFLDNNILTTQIEIRQHIWNVIGVVGWVGCGNIWGEYSNFGWNKTLPNFGLGIRIRVNGGVNMRLDWGCGKNMQNGFVFSINEAF
jgi:hypothetical protein